MKVIHSIPPVYDLSSRILILGSFPSVKSREQGFFYGHPQNRFWKVLAFLFDEPMPKNIEEKKVLLIKNGVALWDVIADCEITGSSDASIKNVTPNDISVILSASSVSKIFTNGKTAFSLYNKYIYPNVKKEAFYLPSTSPANAGMTFEKLCEAWKVILQ